MLKIFSCFCSKQETQDFTNSFDTSSQTASPIKEVAIAAINTKTKNSETKPLIGYACTPTNNSNTPYSFQALYAELKTWL